MLNSQNKKLYKNKLKKYVILKKLKGGGIDKPLWYDDYLNEVDTVYDNDYIITGSGALVIYLNYFNSLENGKFNELIPNLRIPNDVDFLYYCKGADYITSRKLGKYSRLQSVPQRSVTYEFNSFGSFPTFIKSFDLTCLAKINYVKIDKYKLLSLEKLLEFYSSELKDSQIFITNYETDLKDIEQRIEKCEKEKNIVEYFNLKEEQSELISNLEKNNNKILFTELKINIINVLIKHLKTDSEISSKYKIVTVPKYTSTKTEDYTKDETKDETKDDTEDETESVSVSLFQQLFGSPEPITIKNDDDTLKSIDFEGKYSQEESFTSPKVSKKLDFGIETQKTPVLTGTDIKVEYTPYEIKFDFENNL